MVFKLGSTAISTLKLGSTSVTKVMLGKGQIYPTSIPYIYKGTGSSGTYLEGFEDNTLGSWELTTGLTSSPNFQTKSGGTASSDTGPSGAATGTYYVYAETSTPNNSYDTFGIETTDFNVADSISFDYHMYGATIGTLKVQTYDGNIRTDVWTLTGEQQTDELDAYINTGTIDLSGYNVEAIRIFYTGGSSYTGDAAIDNISIVSLGTTVVLNTTDLTEFTTSTPTLEFTGTEYKGDDLRYNIQVSNNSLFQSGIGICDYYSEVNKTTDVYIYGTLVAKKGMSFTSQGGDLYSSEFYLKKVGTVTGTIVSKIFTHTGTYGDVSAPGTLLATSDTIDVSTLGTSYSMEEFIFSGAEQITLTQGTYYIVTVEYTGGDTSNYVHVGIDNSGNHSGTYLSHYDGNWSRSSGYDTCFTINCSGYTLLDKVSGTDAGFANVDTPADTDPFNSGDKCDYDIQAGDALDNGDYFYRARCIAPTGENVYTDWTEQNSFNINI